LSAVEHTTDQPTKAPGGAWDEPAPEATVSLAFDLGEAEALRSWLLKPAADGTNSLEDPLVSRVLARLALEVDSARSAVNVRHELVQAGFAVDHLSDEQVRELGRRIADASTPGARA
jgi:hypothetical protein